MQFARVLVRSHLKDARDKVDNLTPATREKYEEFVKLLVQDNRENILNELRSINYKNDVLDLLTEEEMINIYFMKQF